jgi:hypothetical protein
LNGFCDQVAVGRPQTKIREVEQTKTVATDPPSIVADKLLTVGAAEANFTA